LRTAVTASELAIHARAQPAHGWRVAVRPGGRPGQDRPGSGSDQARIDRILAGGRTHARHFSSNPQSPINLSSVFLLNHGHPSESRKVEAALRTD